MCIWHRLNLNDIFMHLLVIARTNNYALPNPRWGCERVPETIIDGCASIMYVPMRNPHGPGPWPRSALHFRPGPGPGPGLPILNAKVLQCQCCAIFRRRRYAIHPRFYRKSWLRMGTVNSQRTCRNISDNNVRYGRHNSLEDQIAGTGFAMEAPSIHRWEYHSMVPNLLCGDLRMLEEFPDLWLSDDLCSTQSQEETVAYDHCCLNVLLICIWFFILWNCILDLIITITHAQRL